MATAAMFVLPIPIFLAYLVPLDVDVTGNITAKISRGIFKIFKFLSANFMKHRRNEQKLMKLDRNNIHI
jgi:hypothetical protein